MNGKHNKLGKLANWLFGLAGLVLLAGLLISALLIKQSGASRYPDLIADTYQETQHYLTVPGATQVALTRTGAYGIYYQHSLVAAAEDPRIEIPPAIDCSLTSRSTGAKIEAVPDYVATNRYVSQDQGELGVLIMSLTVDQPGAYTFACDVQAGSSQPEIVVALGPNYMWEFLGLAWQIALPLLGGAGVVCGSLGLVALLLIAGVVLKLLNTTTLEG
jgi:hypothetical protein